MANLIERHAQEIVGVLSCFDRLVLQGTLPSVAHPQAMATELDRRDIRFFDYAKQFALATVAVGKHVRTAVGMMSGDCDTL